jgi:hypothetical protein
VVYEVRLTHLFENAKTAIGLTAPMSDHDQAHTLTMPLWIHSFPRSCTMKSPMVRLAAAALALLLAGQLSIFAGGKKEAFPVPKPGPEHKVLAKLAGKWNASVKSWFGPGEPKETKGILTRKMIMNGLYLQENFKGDFLGMPLQGQGVMGYDINKKKYVMAWIDNFGTGISLNQGSYDPDAKTLTFMGEENNPMMGGKMKTRDVLKIVSADEQFFEMFRTPLSTGKEFKVMEIAYTRIKKASKAP